MYTYGYDNAFTLRQWNMVNSGALPLAMEHSGAIKAKFQWFGSRSPLMIMILKSYWGCYCWGVTPFGGYGYCTIHQFHGKVLVSVSCCFLGFFNLQRESVQFDIRGRCCEKCGLPPSRCKTGVGYPSLVVQQLRYPTQVKINDTTQGG